MSAECSTCGSDITYPEGTWPVGRCALCDAYDERDAWKSLALDMGQWMRDASEYIDPVVDVEHRIAVEYVALLARLDQLGKEQT